MNKAFVREPDATEELCPRCGSAGQPVNRATIRHYVPDDVAQSLAEPANFCPKPTCDAAYFDMFERYIAVASLIKPAYPKDPEAPICACFGLTERDIDLDIAEGSKTRTRSVVERSKTPEAQCEQLAANGRCCVADVQRYFMKQYQATQRS